MFDRFSKKFADEKKEIEKERAKFGNKVSNLDLYIDAAFRATSKLAPEWASADYNDRQELQYLVLDQVVKLGGSKKIVCFATLIQLSIARQLHYAGIVTTT